MQKQYYQFAKEIEKDVELDKFNLKNNDNFTMITLNIIDDKGINVNASNNLVYTLARMAFGLGFIFAPVGPTFLTNLESVNFYQIFYAIIASGGLVLGYNLKRNHDYTKVYRKLNQELKDEAIPKKKYEDLDEEYTEKINDLEKDIYRDKLELEIEKINLQQIKEVMENNNINKEQMEIKEEQKLLSNDDPVLKLKR